MGPCPICGRTHAKPKGYRVEVLLDGVWVPLTQPSPNKRTAFNWRDGFEPDGRVFNTFTRNESKGGS